MHKTYQTMNLYKVTTTLLTAGLLTLVSCAQLPNPNGSIPNGENGQAPVTTANTDYNNLLTFANEFPKLSLDAQRKELASLNQTVARDPRTKMQLAIAYGLATSKVRDTTKAQPLLEDIIADKALDTDSLALATIMRDYIIEIGKSGQKARDEQKRADTSQQKLDELQKKLDDLKNIERTMVDRDQGVKK